MNSPELTKNEWNMALQFFAKKKTNGANKERKNAARKVVHNKILKHLGKCLHETVHIKELD